jgi:YidC/Oxa1 family membrane protein insertase
MFHFIGSVFNAFIARPIFNLLILILALIPGHNLGIAIIIFTVIVRVAMYPLLKKQLHHAIAMKKLQPEMKRIKKEAAGDRQKESQLMMALYKEREVNPFSSFGIILVQLPILIALYSGISKIIRDPNSIISYSYSFLHSLPYMQGLEANIHNLNTSLLGFIDLTHPAITKTGVYWPAMILVFLSVAIQYIQSKQLMMTDKSSRSIRQIFKDTASGKEVDQSEVQAATNKFTLFFIPVMLLVISISLAPALSLYWFVGGCVAYWQQTRILNRDVNEMEATVDKAPVEAEIIEPHKPKHKKKKSPAKKRKSSKRRR